jgi:hypothetical protein
VRQISTGASAVFLDVSIDGRVLAMAVAAATTLFFGICPALRTADVAPSDALKEHGRATAGLASSTMTDALVVVQVVLSLVLVIAAGLFVRTFMMLKQRPLGFSASRPRRFCSSASMPAAQLAIPPNA